jgi:hypothetical protein
MSRFRMTRIELPDWADPPDVTREGVSDDDFEAIQQHRQALLDLVQQEVEVYLNDPQLYFTSDAAGFPNRKRLTGEYYIGSELYIAHVKPAWVQISIFCRCVERARGSSPPGDYLGLEVWLKCVPGKWTFEVYRNTDSSSI